MINRLIATFALAFLSLTSPGLQAVGLAAGITSVPPSGRLDFTVQRDGSPIGHHKFRFERDGDTLHVHVDIELVVRIAFIPVYRYRHESRETWTNGRLVALETKTNDNGTDHRVSARLNGDKMEVRGSTGVLSLPAGVRPISHWNAANLRDAALVDTQFGSLIAIETKVNAKAAGSNDDTAASVRSVGLIGYQLQDGRRSLTPWLDVTLWYDAADVLAGLEFNYRGSHFRYVAG